MWPGLWQRRDGRVLRFDSEQQDQDIEHMRMRARTHSRMHARSLSLREARHSLAATEVSIRRHARAKNAPKPEREGWGWITGISQLGGRFTGETHPAAHRILLRGQDVGKALGPCPVGGFLQPALWTRVCFLVWKVTGSAGSASASSQLALSKCFGLRGPHVSDKWEGQDLESPL